MGAVLSISQMGLWLAQNAWVPIAMLILGAILLAVEITLPGFGIFGTCGILLIVGGIVILVEDPLIRVLLLAFLLLAMITMVLLIVHSAKHGRLSRNGLILWASTNRDEGFSSTDEDELKVLEGATGKALTDLRPAGSALFGEQRVDVVSDGMFISKEASVRVTKVEGRRIVVVLAE